MPSVITSLENLIAGIFHTITAALGSILGLFQNLINAILGVIGTAFSAMGTMVAGLAHTFEGLLKFLLSMFFPCFCLFWGCEEPG
jgi:phage-related protein